MASKKITVTDLDFDTIKQNLKTYLHNQTTFQDYDFEGSGLSVLLDILAYNTHYNALYNNLSINEMFLDSARKRNSVVSRAKELGYTPKSAQSATAIVNVTFTSTTTQAGWVIPANTQFSTIIDGKSYIFYNDSLLSSSTVGTSYTFSNVKITEKTNILSKTYTVSDGVKYIIPNQYAVKDGITVSVNSNSIIKSYTLADNIVTVTNTSNVYWLKELDDGLYELVFGDGIIGSALSNGDIVTINYWISSASQPNGAKVFSYGGTPPANTTVTIATISSATGGDYPEDIESIRFNAPRAYSAQNRGVTPDDYKALIYSGFSGAKSVSTWGGEDNIPPVYGKIFICIKPIDAELLTTAQKDFILNTLLPSKTVLTIRPEIVDPEYINILLNTTVYYNELLTNRTSDTLKSIVLDTILNYNSSDLQQFDGIFRHSKLSKLIDNSENSIINNITTITLKRALVPKYNIYAEYNINLINPIYFSGVDEHIVVSSGFYIPNSLNIHYVADDGNGSIVLFYLDSDQNRVIINPSNNNIDPTHKIGTVNYTKGIINFKNLKITSIIGDIWYLYIKPSSNDVVSAMTQIAQISYDDININVIPDKSASGDLRAGQNYTFTTSRI